MKRPFTLICLLGLLISASDIRGQDLSRFDLSTNEGVNAAREALAGKALDDRSKRCLRRDANLPGIVLVGDFRFDYGCYLEGAFIANRYLTARDRGLSKAALNELGWKTANPQQRGALALAWTVKGLMGFVEVLSRKPEAFADHPFEAPHVVPSEQGAVVTLWVRLPFRRDRGQAYQLREFKFSSDGEFTKYTQVEDFPTAKTGDG